MKSIVESIRQDTKRTNKGIWAALFIPQVDGAPYQVWSMSFHTRTYYDIDDYWSSL